MSLANDNPYVGPRTYLREERNKFFGREQEARDLLALIVSERLVLFYAQSGAGKSSLINTRIIPGLEEKGFEVLPVGRVSGESEAARQAHNIYLSNLMHSLVEHENSPALPPELSLSDFLARLNRDDNGYFFDSSPVEPAADPDPQNQPTWPRALILDQFEEIISTHPESWSCRPAIFEQIANAMQADPYLWVVLVMREDYVAALDPYAHLVPGGLRARYYMQQMSYLSALEAIKKPVQQIRPYAPGVAEKLVDDLRAVKVQAPDGATVTQAGQYVEPVQLQVVCLRLWEKLPPGQEITAENRSAVGDVDQSLSGYYAERVAMIAKQTGVKERRIREWINTHLITGQGIRGQVLAEPGSSGGMSNEVIRRLEDAHLVRAEKRGGASWYELTHDRLVEPVRKNNAAWVRDHLTLFQRQAALWEQQRRPEDLLLRGKTLVEAQSWAEQHAEELTDSEKDFLAACLTALEWEKADQERQAQALRLEAAEKMAEVESRRAREQASAVRKLRISAAVMGALLVAAVSFLLLAFYNARIASQETGRAQVEAVHAANNAATAQVANTRLADNINVKEQVIATNQAELASNQTAVATSVLALQAYQGALATEHANLASVQDYYNRLATQNSLYFQSTAGVTPTRLATRLVLVPVTGLTPGGGLIYMLPTVTPTPNAFTFQGITITNVRINGSRQYNVNLKAGNRIDVEFDYAVVSPDCPACNILIQVGLSAQDPQQCIDIGSPGARGRRGSAKVSLFPPSQNGKFFLAFDRALEVNCVHYWWTGNPSPEQFIGRLTIQ